MEHLEGHQTLIGTQRTGRIAGVIIAAGLDGGLSITARGQPARLAVILNENAIAIGQDVAHEFEVVAVDSYRNVLQGQGWVRVFSEPLSRPGATPDHSSAVISAVPHEGLTVTVGGEHAQFAIVAENDAFVVVGKVVAREAEAVAVNVYRDFLKASGILREMRKGPPVTIEDYDGTLLPPRRTGPRERRLSAGQ